MKRIPFHVQSGLLKAALWLIWLLCFAVVVAVALKARKVHAQIGVAEQPMFVLQSVSTYSVTNDPALAYYWNFIDLTNGIVTNWADRKQALTWTRYNTGSGPTKTATGVQFTNTAGLPSLLTNTGVAYASNTIIGIIHKPTSTAGGDTYSGLVSLTNVAAQGAYWVWRKWSGTAGYWEWGAPAHMAFAFPVDWGDKRIWSFLVWSNTQILCWTNKPDGSEYVFSKQNSFSSDHAFRHPGIFWLGHAIGASEASAYRGTVQEILVWTNVMDSQKILTNFWNYTTNTYTFP